MSRISVRNISIILILFAIMVVGAGCDQARKNRPLAAEIGQLAPDFALQDTRGKRWVLSDLEGQVVFINFWATWCPPCRKEMPSMQRLYASMGQEKFKMLAILSNDDPVLADTLAKKLGVTFPIVIDPESETGRAYGITGVPETFIVDKNGILREKYIGPWEWDAPEARQVLDRYLKGEAGGK